MTRARYWKITHTRAGQEDVRGYIISLSTARRVELLHNISVGDVAWVVKANYCSFKYQGSEIRGLGWLGDYEDLCGY
jgi:hypothetical protein